MPPRESGLRRPLAQARSHDGGAGSGSHHGDDVPCGFGQSLRTEKALAAQEPDQWSLALGLGPEWVGRAWDVFVEEMTVWMGRSVGPYK